MGLGIVGRVGAELPFKQTSECEPLFEVDRESDSLTITSNCRGNPAIYEEGEMFRMANEVIPIAEFQRLRTVVDVTFDLRIVIDGDGYVTSATIRAAPETMSEYSGVFETIAKRICSELRADRESHQGVARRFEGIHLTIGGR